MRSPSYSGVIDAARQIAPAAVRTPVIEHPALNDAVGGRVLMKAETFQVAGAFKFRGAYNRISRLSEEELTRGVVAFSSGNHAQGVAAAAKMAGTRSIIVMPSDSPKVKVDGVRHFSGEVRFYDRWTESREDIGAAIAKERGSILVPPFDDPYIIEGQGTCALELLDDADAPIDQLLCGASGGGLLAGINLVMAERSPGTAVHVVEPEDFDDTRRSLEAGERTAHPQGKPSICDALMAPMPGELTFPINRRLAGALTVSDTEVAEAMRFAFRWLKLVIEPGGAVSLAALLSGRIDAGDRTTAIILSGGNVDPDQFGDIIGGRFAG
ncbi:MULTISPECIES: threonine ammonia-lyase [unclassified Brevundimonas]|uniref:threonine ammonia-lyase n=1 Tax=unclassified Brevundimonas TaxID=2622653 RepID=UPI0025C2C086|nr:MULTISPECIES: threonine/serine dehydratase [unclassified Brevundimonas]